MLGQVTTYYARLGHVSPDLSSLGHVSVVMSGKTMLGQVRAGCYAKLEHVRSC
jgi:hypothetical protein